MSVNKATLVGFLGGDPVVRYTKSGTPVANFSLATSDRWTDREGKRQERTEWHRIVVWGKLAELCGEYLKKGRQVYLEGKIQNAPWEKDGIKHSGYEIKADEVTFLGGGRKPETTASVPTPLAEPNLDGEDAPF